MATHRMTTQNRAAATFVAVLAITCAASDIAGAAAPSILPIQGSLADNNGVAVDGTASLTFSLYDTEMGTTPLYTETLDVEVSGGLFVAHLGTSMALDLTIWRDNSDPAIDTMTPAGEQPQIAPCNARILGLVEHPPARGNDCVRRQYEGVGTIPTHRQGLRPRQSLSQLSWQFTGLLVFVTRRRDDALRINADLC